MGAISVQCFLKEDQLNDIVNYVCDYINQTDFELISELYEDMHDAQFKVDFDKSFGILSVKECFILDDDWNVSESDTQLFSSMLDTIVSDYNTDRRKSIRQSIEILKDQLNYIPC